MKLFLGIIRDESGRIVHSHIVKNADDTFQVEIYDKEDNMILFGEYHKWHHLTHDINMTPNLKLFYESYEGYINEEILIKLLK